MQLRAASAVVGAMLLSSTSAQYKTARDSGYAAPAESYGAPSSLYDEPAPNEYVAYQPSGEGSLDVTPILIGILVVTGLALLFPSYVTLTAIRRRKRSAEDIQVMISKLAMAALAAAVTADDVSAVYADTLYRRDGGSHSHSSSGGGAYGAPEPSYGAPEPSYSAPSPSYSAPASSYGAPEPSYSAPSPSYGSPEPSYGAPEPSYGAPSYGYEEAGAGLDLTSILIPILALLGLSLLFPTFVTINGTGRRKREAGDEDESPAANMLDRVQDMYMAIMESEECFERVICELGGLVEDAGYSKQMTKSLEMFAPKKYAKMMKSFNHGKDCKKNNKCGLF